MNIKYGVWKDVPVIFIYKSDKGNDTVGILYKQFYENRSGFFSDKRHPNSIFMMKGYYNNNMAKKFFKTIFDSDDFIEKIEELE